jgi:DNA-binding NarL/FixJ family response regulator
MPQVSKQPIVGNARSEITQLVQLPVEYIKSINAIIIEPSPMLGRAMLQLLSLNERFCSVNLFSISSDIPKSIIMDSDLFILDVSNCPDIAFSFMSSVSKIKKSLILATDNNPSIRMAQKCFFYNTTGYIGKHVKLEEFEEALNNVCNGVRYISQAFVSNWVMEPKKKINNNNTPTQREMEILRLIVHEYSTIEIAQKLFIGKCTVESHRLNLLQKFGVKNTAGLVREAVLLYRSEIIQ